jgi:hypothetical protein
LDPAESSHTHNVLGSLVSRVLTYPHSRDFEMLHLHLGK